MCIEQRLIGGDLGANGGKLGVRRMVRVGGRRERA